MERKLLIERKKPKKINYTYAEQILEKYLKKRKEYEKRNTRSYKSME